MLALWRINMFDDLLQSGMPESILKLLAPNLPMFGKGNPMKWVATSDRNWTCPDFVAACVAAMYAVVCLFFGEGFAFETDIM